MAFESLICRSIGDVFVCIIGPIWLGHRLPSPTIDRSRQDRIESVEPQIEIDCLDLLDLPSQQVVIPLGPVDGAIHLYAVTLPQQVLHMELLWRPVGDAASEMDLGA
jgi:hypothetical protein